MIVVCPTTELDRSVVEVLKSWSNKLRTCRDDFSTHVVLHTHRELALGECEQLINQNSLEVVNLVLEFLVNLRKFLTVGSLFSTSLDYLREKFLVDYHTAE